MDIMQSCIINNDKKILLIVIDGLGGLPINSKTELETALTPHLDKLASMSSLGLTTPVDIGITPGSGPAHLALFGYDPVQYQIGRGVLEAVGVGHDINPDDLCVRANFATIKNGIITDRRAGRIPTQKNQRLCDKLSSQIKKIDDVEIIIHPGKEHRFVIVFRGKDLSSNITESDPQKDDKPPVPVSPLKNDAIRSTEIVNKFIQTAAQIIEDEPQANYFLMRGFAHHPNLKPMSELYNIKPAVIATYPMYKGIAKLVGMDILDCSETWESEIETLAKNYSEYNFFYLHFKEVDMKGEDGDFSGKVKLIEKFDALLPDIQKLNFDVLAITSDHSTPAVLKGHSWHPNPFLLHSEYCRQDNINKFSEKSCAQGNLGNFPQTKVMQLLLANSLKLKKYGA
ncbi:MAG: 2,3-bisphosphoglycerate-independent phosphoglycerate mutase [Candidatus Latescibacteria bacterium]|nr:2,3-bisphosphoglycerate-independent phosphoglycerate mutase [Candidatus Latescibacterota bacterium]